MGGADGLETITAMAACLAPADKIRLIERVASALERQLTASRLIPRRSLHGWCADLGVAPSAGQIDEARHDVWGSFPREDIS